MVAPNNEYARGMYSSHRVNQTNEERLVSDSLMVADLPAEIIAQIRPPLPQINPFPPRLGYGDRAERVPTLQTAFTVSRWQPDNRADWSGNLMGSYHSSMRPSNSFAW